MIDFYDFYFFAELLLKTVIDYIEITEKLQLDQCRKALMHKGLQRSAHSDYTDYTFPDHTPEFWQEPITRTHMRVHAYVHMCM